jgi:antitoxin MazE
MRSAVRKMGNSSEIIIPKPVLAEIGLKAGDDVDLAVEDGRLVIVALKPHRRAGWAEDASRIAEAGDDHLVLGEFGNNGDDDLTW